MAWARMKKIRTLEPMVVEPEEHVVNIDQIVWWRGHGERVEVQFSSGGSPEHFMVTDRLMEVLTGTSPLVLGDQIPKM